ncbi:RHS repeat-associated core domain-containing protein [Pseudomonas sp. NPDC012596]|uniref:RHS repeat-associated core domain-containing protein n=1 Tax=Pseudomonas sp. NPDC012596 TaxID=3364419 RepID=UPI0036CA8CFB
MNRSPKHSLFFYKDDKLVTRLQGDEPCSLLRMGDITLAERTVKGTASTLLTSDIKGSTFGTEQANANHSHAYTPYGFCAELYSLLGFNGEYFDRVLGGYLPHSYRIYDSRLMRFHSPDDLSPFLKGGLNPYTFCSGDPINYTDPTGHTQIPNIHSAVYVKTVKTKFSVPPPGQEEPVITRKIQNVVVFNVNTDKSGNRLVPVVEHKYPEFKHNLDFITLSKKIKETPHGQKTLTDEHAQAVVKNLESNGRLSGGYRTPSPDALIQAAQHTNAYIIASSERLVTRALDPNDGSASIRGILYRRP